MPIKSNPLVHFIETQIQKQLPGANAQKLMMPRGRIIASDKADNPKPSAVLLMLFYDSKEINLVMIKRAEYNGVHSGQIAFPGGKKETQDKNMLETALRETYEEVGIKKTQIQVIGKLSPLYIPVSNMCVHPWVGFYDQRPVFVKQDKEVQQVLSVPLQKLMHKKTQTISVFKGENYEIEAPCYQLNGTQIWGASAMILSEFLHLMNDAPAALLKTDH